MPARPAPYHNPFGGSPSQRMLMRPTTLGSLMGERPVNLDKPKVRAPRLSLPKSQFAKDVNALVRKAEGRTAPAKKGASKKAPAKKTAKKSVAKTKPNNFGYVMEKAYAKQCSAWTQIIDHNEGQHRFYVNAPRGQRFKTNGLHGAYRTAYLLTDGTWEWVGTANGFLDLRRIVEAGFYYCYDDSCDFHDCPRSYRGPRRNTRRPNKKPPRGEGMLFGPDGTGNKITWDDEGMMVIEPVAPEFHTFETVT